MNYIIHQFLTNKQINGTQKLDLFILCGTDDCNIESDLLNYYIYYNVLL